MHAQTTDTAALALVPVAHGASDKKHLLSIRAIRETLVERRADRRRRRGYSLPELLLGAAVIAAFLVRVYQSYSATNAADKYEDFTQEIGLLNGTVHETYINSPDYSGIDTTGTALVGNLPRKYLTSDNAHVTTAYKQNITFAATKLVNDGDAFTMSTSIPASECVKTAFGDMGRNLVAISVGGAAVSFQDATTGTPVDSKTTTGLLTAACAGKTGQTMMPIVWTFN